MIEGRGAGVGGLEVLDGLEVLVVEDDPVSRTLATHLLTRLGAAARSVPTGEAMLELLDQPDGATVGAVLVGLRLPDGDGRQVVRRLRDSDGAQRQVPVVALSASADHALDASCRSAGCDAVLRKPVHLEALREILTALVGVPAPDNQLVDQRALADMADDLGDPEIARLTVGIFLDAADGRSEALASAVAVAEPDRVELQRLAHSLKSAAAIVGARQLSDLCQGLERAAEAGDPAQLRGQVSDVVRLMPLTCAALRVALDAIG